MAADGPQPAAEDPRRSAREDEPPRREPDAAEPTADERAGDRLERTFGSGDDLEDSV
jgi:hypothetical protein